MRGWPLKKFACLVPVAAVTAALLGADARPAPPRPNVVLILADDLGYGDVGFNGGKEIPTPHLDALAREGVRFASGYASAPLCSPTRAGLLTGRYQQRFGWEQNPKGDDKKDGVGMDKREILLPAALKPAGYTCGLVGKWHLGVQEGFHPMDRGFDTFVGSTANPGSSFLDAKTLNKGRIMRGRTPLAPGGADEGAYLTDLLTREATAFIETNRAKPFFLYLAYTAVHVPLEAPQTLLDRFANIPDKNRRVYAAALSALDTGVGTVLKKLDETGLAQDTLVIFLSDNGGSYHNTSSKTPNAPLQGDKGTVWEGGIRVPFLLRWPARIQGGRAFEPPVISLDLFPTILAAVGVPSPEGVTLDGVDLLPFLTGQRQGTPHETLFWRMGDKRAVRQGNLKWLRADDGHARLYDLEKDVGEERDLAPEKPDVAARLAQAIARWEQSLPEPPPAQEKEGKKKRKKERGE